MRRSAKSSSSILTRRHSLLHLSPRITKSEKGRRSNPSYLHPANDTVDIFDETVVINTIKRKRGRPRKQPAQQEENCDEIDIQETSMISKPSESFHIESCATTQATTNTEEWSQNIDFNIPLGNEAPASFNPCHNTQFSLLETPFQLSGPISDTPPGILNKRIEYAVSQESEPPSIPARDFLPSRNSQDSIQSLSSLEANCSMINEPIRENDTLPPHVPPHNNIMDPLQSASSFNEDAPPPIPKDYIIVSPVEEQNIVVSFHLTGNQIQDDSMLYISVATAIHFDNYRRIPLQERFAW